MVFLSIVLFYSRGTLGQMRRNNRILVKSPGCKTSLQTLHDACLLKKFKVIESVGEQIGVQN